MLNNVDNRKITQVSIDAYESHGEYVDGENKTDESVTLTNYKKLKSHEAMG